VDSPLGQGGDPGDGFVQDRRGLPLAVCTDMARGLDPKLKEERRRRNEPARGEWVDLPPLKKPVLPTLPGEGQWSKRTRLAWEAWRSDPVTSQYQPADVQAAIDLAFVYERWVRGKDSLLSEIRQREDRLGLSPKGKRDLRWRVAEAKEEPKRQPRRATKRAHLTAVK
jgi:hypothetical protein